MLYKASHCCFFFPFFLFLVRTTQKKMSQEHTEAFRCNHSKYVTVRASQWHPTTASSYISGRPQKSPLWRGALKRYVFGDRFHRIRVNSRPNRRKNIRFRARGAVFYVQGPTNFSWSLRVRRMLWALKMVCLVSTQYYLVQLQLIKQGKSQ